MGGYLFRCPNTGYRVQGWSADEVEPDDDERFETTTCLACGHVHLVNPATGKVMGDSE